MLAQNNKIIFLFLILISFVPTSLLFATQSNDEPYIDWRKRPEFIQLQIQTTFEKLERSTTSCWGVYNGDEAYNMCGLSDLKLIKALISEAPLYQKEFFIVDIGAGNFDWGRNIASIINEQTNLRKDININILSLRAEQNLEVSKTYKGQCTLYEYGSFKIEELMSEFTKRGHTLENQLDLVVSRWCLRHLVDPAGTFLQIVNLLRPKSGLAVMDGFFLLYNNEFWENYIEDIEAPFSHMLDVLINTKASYLVSPYNSDRSINRFIIRRVEDKPSCLPLSYMTLITVDKSVSSSGFIMQYNYHGQQQRYDPEKLKILTIAPPRLPLWGDKTLYDWICEKNIFIDNVFKPEYGGKISL